MTLKPEHLNKRVSIMTTKGAPLVVVLSKTTPKKVLKEIALKWPQWVEKTKKDAAQEPTPTETEEEKKEESTNEDS